MMEAEKHHLATTFIAGLRARDASLLGTVLTEDVVWSIPGSSIVSGEAKGRERNHRASQPFCRAVIEDRNSSCPYTATPMLRCCFTIPAATMAGSWMNI